MKTSFIIGDGKIAGFTASGVGRTVYKTRKRLLFINDTAATEKLESCASGASGPKKPHKMTTFDVLDAWLGVRANLPAKDVF